MEALNQKINYCIAELQKIKTSISNSSNLDIPADLIQWIKDMQNAGFDSDDIKRMKSEIDYVREVGAFGSKIHDTIANSKPDLDTSSQLIPLGGYNLTNDAINYIINYPPDTFDLIRNDADIGYVSIYLNETMTTIKNLGLTLTQQYSSATKTATFTLTTYLNGQKKSDYVAITILNQPYAYKPGQLMPIGIFYKFINDKKLISLNMQLYGFECDIMSASFKIKQLSTTVVPSVIHSIPMININQYTNEEDCKRYFMAREFLPYIDGVEKSNLLQVSASGDDFLGLGALSRLVILEQSVTIQYDYTIDKIDFLGSVDLSNAMISRPVNLDQNYFGRRCLYFNAPDVSDGIVDPGDGIETNGSWSNKDGIVGGGLFYSVNGYMPGEVYAKSSIVFNDREYFYSDITGPSAIPITVSVTRGDGDKYLLSGVLQVSIDFATNDDFDAAQVTNSTNGQFSLISDEMTTIGLAVIRPQIINTKDQHTSLSPVNIFIDDSTPEPVNSLKDISFTKFSVTETIPLAETTMLSARLYIKPNFSNLISNIAGNITLTIDSVDYTFDMKSSDINYLNEKENCLMSNWTSLVNMKTLNLIRKGRKSSSHWAQYSDTSGINTCLQYKAIRDSTTQFGYTAASMAVIATSSYLPTEVNNIVPREFTYALSDAVTHAIPVWKDALGTTVTTPPNVPYSPLRPVYIPSNLSLYNDSAVTNFITYMRKDHQFGPFSSYQNCIPIYKFSSKQHLLIFEAPDMYKTISIPSLATTYLQMKPPQGQILPNLAADYYWQDPVQYNLVTDTNRPVGVISQDVDITQSVIVSGIPIPYTGADFDIQWKDLHDNLIPMDVVPDIGVQILSGIDVVGSNFTFELLPKITAISATLTFASEDHPKNTYLVDQITGYEQLVTRLNYAYKAISKLDLSVAQIREIISEIIDRQNLIIEEIKSICQQIDYIMDALTHENSTIAAVGEVLTMIGAALDVVAPELGMAVGLIGALTSSIGAFSSGNIAGGVLQLLMAGTMAAVGYSMNTNLEDDNEEQFAALEKIEASIPNEYIEQIDDIFGVIGSRTSTTSSGIYEAYDDSAMQPGFEWLTDSVFEGVNSSTNINVIRKFDHLNEESILDSSFVCDAEVMTATYYNNKEKSDITTAIEGGLLWSARSSISSTISDLPTPEIDEPFSYENIAVNGTGYYKDFELAIPVKELIASRANYLFGIDRSNKRLQSTMPLLFDFSGALLNIQITDKNESRVKKALTPKAFSNFLNLFNGTVQKSTETIRLLDILPGAFS